MLLPSVDFALGHIFRLHLGLDLDLCLLWRLFNSNLTLISHNPLVLMFQQFPGFPAYSLWDLVVWAFNSVQARAEISWSSGFSWPRFPVSSWHGAPNKPVRHTLLYWPSFLPSVYSPRTASEVSQIAWAGSLCWRSGTLLWSWMTVAWLAASFRARSYLRIPGPVRALQWQLKRAVFRIYCQILANLTYRSLAIQPPATCWWRNLPMTLTLSPVNVFVSDAKIYLLKGKAFSGFAFGREVIIRTNLIECQMLHKMLYIHYQTWSSLQCWEMGTYF